jgi:hypothetical protein
LNREHRALHKQMSETSSSFGNKKTKRYQKVNGVQFLAAWSKRLREITSELPEEGQLKVALERWQASRQTAPSSSSSSSRKNESSGQRDQVAASPPTPLSANITTTQPKKRGRSNNNMCQMPWSPDIVQEEVKLRKVGLTSGRLRSTMTTSKIAVTIPLPFGLKKILVEQWELICQCGMLPILPSPITIRQALDAYVASKGGCVAENHHGIKDSSSNALVETPCRPESAGSAPLSQPPPPTDEAGDSTTDAVAAGIVAPSSSPEQPQDWRIMADGIVQLFNESLPIRLLYDQEVIPQLEVEPLLSSSLPPSSSSSPVPSQVPSSLPSSLPSPVPRRTYADIYGCEHLLRLFVQLPDLLWDGNGGSNNTTHQQRRQIVAKVNDLVRFLHKNHGTHFRQQNQKAATTARPDGVTYGVSNPVKKQKVASCL